MDKNLVPNASDCHADTTSCSNVVVLDHYGIIQPHAVINRPSQVSRVLSNSLKPGVFCAYPPVERVERQWSAYLRVSTHSDA